MSAPQALADVLVRQQEEEREQALRALLMQPLLPATDPAYPLVRRHVEALREWLQRELGWPLQLEREAARLYKRPADSRDAERGGAGFDRGRYVLLCLVCMVLERADAQITLRMLGERLREAGADPELAAAGFAFTLEPIRERRDLVFVCRFLLELGVLARVAGDEEGFVSQSGDVLYDVHRRVLALLPGSVRGASLIHAGAPTLDFESQLAALIEEFVADSEEGRRSAIRHRLARRLLDDPVLYHDRLSEAEQAYFISQRGPLASRLAAATGLIAELRAEGVALVDPDGELSDERLPAQGTEAHVTLLLAEHLAAAARVDPERLHSLAELAAFVRAAGDRYGRYWRKSAREAGSERALAEQAIERLQRLSLVCRVEGAVRVRPALFRFALAEPETGSLL
jgi:uncharacterized protein (TIGR02678 family)